jgi:hypothetical protein
VPHAPTTQLERKSKRIYHDECIWLSVVSLARAGWFVPGIHKGDAEAFSAEFTDWGVSVPISTAMHAEKGVLRVDAPGELMQGMLVTHWPREQEIELVRLDSLPKRPRWYFTCPGCQRRTRRLFLPESEPGVVLAWLCRCCWPVTYRDYRADRLFRRNRLDRLDDLVALMHDLRVLQRHTLQGLEESP